MHQIHQDWLDKTAYNLTILTNFFVRHSDKFPTELLVNPDADSCRVCIHITNDNENFRTQILTIIGEVFGRTDWMAELDYRGQYYDWEKEVDEVKVRIFGAQGTGVKEKFPVNPKMFPLQLQESAS